MLKALYIAVLAVMLPTMSQAQYKGGSIIGEYYLDYSSAGYWYAVYSQSTPATPVYTNSLHEINMTLWSNSVAEYLMEENYLPWVTHSKTNSTDFLTTNTITTLSSIDFNASTNGAVTNQYMTLNASTDYALATCTPIATNKPFTTMVWIRVKEPLTSYDSWYSFPIEGGSRCFGILESLDANYAPFSFGSSSGFGTFRTLDFVPHSKWHHVAIIYDGINPQSSTSFACYIDGRSRALVNSSSFGVNLNTKMLIGAQNGYSGSIDIDSITVLTNLALLATQVTNCYLTTKERVLYAPLDDYPDPSIRWTMNTSDITASNTLPNYGTNAGCILALSGAIATNDSIYFDSVDDGASCVIDDPTTYSNAYSKSVWVYSLRGDSFFDYIETWSGLDHVENHYWRVGGNSVFADGVRSMVIWANPTGLASANQFSYPLSFTGEWHQVCVSYNKANNPTVDLYIDGQKLTTRRIDYQFTGALGIIRLGGITADSSSNFKGYLDDYCLWNTNLSHGQIKKMYTEGRQ